LLLSFPFNSTFSPERFKRFKALQA